MKPYFEYKDSGVPWLGHVPHDWEVVALRHRYLQCLGKMLDSKRNTGASPVPYLRNIDVQWDHINTSDLPKMDIAPGEFGRYTVQRGDLLVCEGGEVGRCAFWNGQLELCGFQKALHRLRPIERRRDVPRFLYYLLFVASKRGAFADGHESTIAHLTGDKLRAHRLVFPPFADQIAISRFLDHTDRQVRRLVRAKRKVIALLSEQRDIMIHQLVTRGLCLGVELKPSGTAWLSKVPRHWKVTRNGQLFVQRNETGFADLPILEVSLKTGVRVRDFEKSDRKQVMSDRDKYKRAVKGDIAYNMMRMWQGAVGVAPVDGLVSPAYVVAKPLDGVEPRYFANLFRTSPYMNEVDRYSRGIVKDRNRLYWEDFKQIVSCCPPRDEQVKISDAIDRETRTLNEGIARIEREIELTQEYRTRLIETVVTGKFDVRELAAGLSDSSQDAAQLDEVEPSTRVEDEGDDPNLGIPAEEAEA